MVGTVTFVVLVETVAHIDFRRSIFCKTLCQISDDLGGDLGKLGSLLQGPLPRFFNEQLVGRGNLDAIHLVGSCEGRSRHLADKTVRVLRGIPNDNAIDHSRLPRRIRRPLDGGNAQIAPP